MKVHFSWILIIIIFISINSSAKDKDPFATGSFIYHYGGDRSDSDTKYEVQCNGTLGFTCQVTMLSLSMTKDERCTLISKNITNGFVVAKRTKNEIEINQNENPDILVTRESYGETYSLLKKDYKANVELGEMSFSKIKIQNCKNLYPVFF